MAELLEVMDTAVTDFMNFTTTVGPEPAPHYSLGVGFIAVALAAVLFGSNLLPIKKFETGDGMFFQWIYCASVWITGFVVNIVKGFPVFHPLAMLGGFLWCTGNVLTVPILKTIGLGQGILIWASVNLLAGWASDRFGWFGLVAQHPHSDALNYSGVALCLLSAVVYMFLKTNATRPGASQPSPGADSSLIAGDAALNSSLTDSDSKHEPVFYDKMSPVGRRIFGTVAAIVAGILFGLNFVPVIYIQDNCANVSHDGLDYVFAHFSGIFATSTVYLAIYCAVMRNHPRVYPRVILPGFVSGILWGIADICWFIANDALSPPISFPIITSLPAIIGALWGMIAFAEIRGRKNYIILSIAIFFAVSGSVLTGLSKSTVAGAREPPEPHDRWNCTRL
jgi:hypothetical protein